MKREIILIAAVSENGVIGNNGKIPWKIPEDVKRFRRVTLNHPIIMGRKTSESIGHPLKDRTNIVVTRNQNFNPNDTIIVHSIEDAVREAEKYDKEKIYVIGGGEIDKKFLEKDLATKLDLTEVEGEYKGDAYFPEIDRDKWKETSREKHDGYSFVIYERR